MKRLPAILALLALSLALAACQGTTNQNSQPTTGSAASYIGSQSDLRASRYGSDVEEAYQRGSQHFSGLGVPKNRAEAARWFRVAAEGSHPEAQSFLGMMYENGMGVRQDSVEALKWYRLAAALGDANAAADERRLARRMSNSEIAEAERKARNWEKTRATGSRSGQLATNGTPGRTQSAEQSYAEHLAQSYVPGDASAATGSGHSRAPAGNEHRVPSPDALLTAAEAAFNRGAEAYAREDYAEAARWMRESAKQGHARAQDNLGVMYTIGLGVPKDGQQAERWFLEAAGQGLAASQKNLGIMYRDGQGVPQDYAAATRWFRQAADQGNPEAQFALGSMYLDVTAGSNDRPEGIRLIKAAAEQGHAGALSALGLFHEHGVNVRRDPVEALMYYGLGALRGEQKAERAFDRLAGKLSQADILEAKARSGVWIDSYNARLEQRQREAEERERTRRENAKHESATAPPPSKGTAQSSRLPTVTASAQADYEAAKAAYDRGDYAASIDPLLRAAQQGHSEAQNSLGTQYAEGQGVPKDYGEAARWFRLAANQGNDSAQKNLGRLYLFGEGVRQDHAEAARWFQKSATLGNPNAQILLGGMSYDGQGMSRDFAQAARWYSMAAEQGHAGAQGLLGMMYVLGEGVPEDLVAAKMWLILAERGGSERASTSSRRLDQYLSTAEIAEAERRAEQWEADFRRGQRTAGGRQVVASSAAPAPQSRATAKRSEPTPQSPASTRAAPKPVAAVSPGPAYEKALRALLRDDQATAAKWLRVEAERGYGPAMGLLGTLYLDGHGVEQDYDEALRWLRPAAEQGDANAQSSLGAIYEFGKGLPKDIAEAARWYRMGAKGGNGYAQYRLGSMYMSTSSPMPQDDVQAVRWLSAAAEQNLAPAQTLLGSLYGEGRGVKEDLVTAQMWLTLATTQGDSFGRVMGELNAEQMTAAEIAEAERRAATWLRDFQSRQPG